jgi:hypothetical protein
LFRWQQNDKHASRLLCMFLVSLLLMRQGLDMKDSE